MNQNKEKFQLGQELETFLVELASDLGSDVTSLDLFTEHKRFDQKFRGSPHYRGKPWRDWAMIDWGNDVTLPGQIWIFVDLQQIPLERCHEPGVYAVIESANPNPDKAEQDLSQIFEPFLKERKKNGRDLETRQFYLVPVASFDSPICLIPDHGNTNPAAYLKLTPRKDWAAQFSVWLGLEHSKEFPR